MSASAGEIIELLKVIAPVEDAEAWDNVGLLAGSAKREVSCVLCALDFSEAVLKEAIERKAQMIVTHHPILFRGRKNLCADTAEGRALCALAASGIALYTMHTNYDNACPGVNDALAKALGLEDVIAVERALRVGSVRPAALKDFAASAQKALGGVIRAYGPGDRVIRRVAVLGGSGGDYLEAARQAGADVFLTGEISYHAALLGVEEGICVLEAGHAATERPGILALSGSLQIALDAVQYNVGVIDSQTELYL